MSAEPPPPPPPNASSRTLYRRFRAELRQPESAWDGSAESRGGTPAATPTADAAAGRTKSHFRDYLRLIAIFKWRIAFVLGLGLVVKLCETLQPRLIGEAIDKVLQPGLDLPADEKLRRLTFYAGVTLALIVVARALDAWRDFRTHALNTRVMSRLRRALFSQFIRFPIARLHELKVGGVVSRLTGDLEAVAGLIQLAFVSPVMALAQVIMVFVTVWQWNAKLALVLLALLVPMAFGSFMWVGPLRKFWKYYYRSRSQSDSRLHETFGGIRVVRAFQREDHEERRYATAQHALARLNLHGVRLSAVTAIMWTLLIPLANLAVLYFGGRLLLADDADTSLGQLTAMMGYTGMLMGPIWSLVSTFNDMQRSLAALDRMMQHLREPDEVDDPPGAVEAPTRVGDMVFDRVEFAYTPEKAVIHSFSLTVPAGTTVAFVGASGSGKSTLADLVARFYRPTGGEIRLNGIPLEKIRLHSYRRLLGIVSQDVFLFDGTIAENLAYGRPEATRGEIIAAAKQANAHDFIADLPQGYDTPIGERGAKLSGGQRQRLSIARAIVADPQILILDEATSALDTHSERLIQTAIDALQRDRTTFVIAHRLSTIANADAIVVLEKGRMIECGTHPELMELRGRYWHMVEQQREALAAEERAR